MFASKSERKVHYSIRKFSIGVASVVVASLFLGGVVHATEKEGSTQAATSSNMANKSQTEHRKAAEQVDEYINKMIQLDKRKHTQNLALNIKLSAIKTKYLRELNVLEEKSKKEELTSKTKKEIDAAFEQFNKDTLKPGEKVAEAQKKVEEAKKKAEDQKEEDRRNYPTNTYKTLELEIAESDVEVKKAELELVKEEAKEPRNEEKVKQPAPAPKTGWKQENGMWYFYNTDGSMATGWLQNNGSWYYLNSNGAMATGWLQNNGSWYYLNANGSMATGWLQNNGSWYYLNANGSMATGWLQNNGSWYYLNSNGAMATGWLQNNGSWYYLNANGSMATDWVKDGDTWYYLEASGAMKASQWFKVSDKWYYVNGLGALAVNTTVDGYGVNANGEWVN
ncbi:RICH domain-containing protein [Streptococcus pneumoniae]|nr:RICH domain-containing protein [Streptococcus pneumoniae]